MNDSGFPGFFPPTYHSLLNGFILVVFIGGSAKICIKYLMVMDPEHGLDMMWKVNRYTWSYSFPVGFYIGMGLNHLNWIEKAGSAGLAAYLLIASITDLQTQKVYDVLHVAGTAIGGMLLLMHPPEAMVMTELIFFCMLQYFLFRYLYGDADVMAFMVCAVFESISGGGILSYLLHMASAFLILGIVQFTRGNINKKGNLKIPTAFLPYISITVWLFL